jgi:hypothetical protein
MRRFHDGKRGAASEEKLHRRAMAGPGRLVQRGRPVRATAIDGRPEIQQRCDHRDVSVDRGNVERCSSSRKPGDRIVGARSRSEQLRPVSDQLANRFGLAERAREKDVGSLRGPFEEEARGGTTLRVPRKPSNGRVAVFVSCAELRTGVEKSAGDGRCCSPQASPELSCTTASRRWPSRSRTNAA